MPTLRPLTALALSAALAGCASSPPSQEPPSQEPPAQMCTEIGCVDGLTIEFVPNSGWRPGQYEFVIDADGVVTTCKGPLPLPPCEQGSALACAPASDLVRIGESGCALPAAQHGFSELRVGGAPVKSLSLTVREGGKDLVQKTFTPAYQTSRPNGPNCEPECKSAAEKLAIPNAAP